MIALGFMVISCGTQDSSRLQSTLKSSPPEVNQTAEQFASPQPASSNNFRMPPYLEDPVSAGPLYPTLAPASVPSEAQAEYAIAQGKPELLAQLPCFCYCDRFGHGSLHDCYVTDHAVHCDVCLKEVIEADQMDKEGMTPQEIRSLIVAKYHPHS